MGRRHLKPAFASLLFMIIISVNGRPSDVSFENDLGDKNGVQMYSSSDGQSSEPTPPADTRHSRNQHRSPSSPPSPDLLPPILTPPFVPQTPDQNLRNPPEQLDQQPASPPIRVMTSHNNSTSDLQCKSESKPIYFKAILNRLRAPKRPEIELIRKPPARHMECRSESKVLNLRTKSRTPSSADISWLPSQPQQSHHLSRRENARHLTPSNQYKSYSRTAVEQWRDMVREHYQRHLPAHLLNPYLAAEHTPSTSPAPNPSPAYLFFKTSSQNQPFQPTTVSSLSPAQLLLSDAKQTTNNVLIEVSEVDRRSVSRNNVPVTKIILKPLARAKAGQGGVAISSPVSTAYIKRGDYVEIEYLPEAIADVGEGGVALSRPELVIHFVDRRRR